MKICAIICEYNPFHNGHLYQLSEAKRLSGADAVLCIMSGNFVQRGEAAIMDKYTRAKHAVIAGTDIVIELPTVFATSNAELFAKGAIHVLSSIPSISTLCFGCETADKEKLLYAAKLLNDEPQEVSEKIKRAVDDGISYAKARAQAWAELISPDLISQSNNILGLEYTKALLACHSPIEILPIQRVGAHYNDGKLQENYSSATAIRAALESGLTYEQNLPEFVAKDMPNKQTKTLDVLEKYAVLSTNADTIANVCDCKEGLENAFKKAAIKNETLVETLTSARYTSSRIRRIALQNLLKIEETLIRKSLSSELYLRVLAVKKGNDELLGAINESVFPTILRGRDKENLCESAKQCYEKDIFAEEIYSLLYPTNNEKNIFI